MKSDSETLVGMVNRGRNAVLSGTRKRSEMPRKCIALYNTELFLIGESVSDTRHRRHNVSTINLQTPHNLPMRHRPPSPTP
jgi:hypothetical protein